MSTKKGRILSGFRPTGKVHLGHWVGALANWVNLQDEYECFFEVADWHALTTGYQDTSKLRENTLEMVVDWLAAGLDPDKNVIFVQSRVIQHAELFLYFCMLTPTPWLIRNPVVKEQARDLGLVREDEEVTAINFGHLGYPVLQAADILVYKACAVPVGEDQVPHLELTREIARRFNTLYAPVFPEPQALLTKFARVPGTDGKRMSKSLGNTLLLSDPPEELLKKIRGMVTDPRKVYKGDVGHPDICAVFALQLVFNVAESEHLRTGCETGSLGCVDCKKSLVAALGEALRPIQAYRAQLVADMGRIERILENGCERARAVAEDTMKEVRRALLLW